jgi:hypothetical protein
MVHPAHIDDFLHSDVVFIGNDSSSRLQKIDAKNPYAGAHAIVLNNGELS